MQRQLGIVRTREVIHLSTSFDYPPIPLRVFDWSAIDDSTYGGIGSCIGRGDSELTAINDLLDQLEES